MMSPHGSAPSAKSSAKPTASPLESPLALPHESGPAHRAWRYGGGAVIVAALGVFIVWLAMGPTHAVSSAEACDAAFKKARSRTDTIAAALLSFPDPSGHRVNRRCGETQDIVAAVPWR
ncbi:MAG: hypothetical protein K2Y26_01775 [Gemmatimonadaceae bacterium]|nr:hypothetical protein [Gemmatimonadaceae bacterium]MBX9854220.1 hypothetical protein [Gemmatimonadaceae bacterium]